MFSENIIVLDHNRIDTTSAAGSGEVYTLASLYMIGICISLVVKFRFELDCDDESMPTYSRRLIIQTFRGSGKKFIISRVCHSCIERFYEGSINSRETYFSFI